jgi:dolichyl-phosphate beta-glucosyltransferase
LEACVRRIYAPAAVGRYFRRAASVVGVERKSVRRVEEAVVSLFLTGLIFWALLRHFDLRQTMEVVRHAHANLLILGGFLMVIAYLLRAARWRIWERSLSYWNSLRLILIGFMGNNVLPARLGEILRAHCTAQMTCESRGRTSALGSIAAERILDGLVLGVFGLDAIYVVPLEHHLQWVLLLPSLFFAVLTATLVFTLHRHDWVRSLSLAAEQAFPGRFTTFARDKAARLLGGLLPLGTVPRMTGAIATTAIIWGVEIGACYVFGRAVWGGMSLRTALLFLVVVNFASLVPLTLGGIGTIEAVGPLFLTSSGVSAPLALAMVLLQHAWQYFFTTIGGGILYLTGGFNRIPIARPKATALPAVLPPSTSVIEEARAALHQLSTSLETRPTPCDEMALSIVIPAYNEQARLPRTVLDTILWCTSRGLRFELIIVDDGSRDETLALSRLFEESEFRVRALACPHLGKGAAVRTGMLNAKGRFVLFMDADGATPLDEIPKLLAAVQGSYDVAIGSRVAQRSREVEVRTPFQRLLIGRTFAGLVKVFALDGVSDTQCGFKMFRREAAAAIFSRQKLAGFAFDVEILFIARRLSLSIAEIPVNWVAQPGSKVNLIADSVRMQWDLSRIRWVHRNLHPRRSAEVRGTWAGVGEQQ